MFTLEIGGTPVALTDADEDEARAFFGAERFKTDMRRWQTDGRPLWDGSAPFDVRPATEDEAAQFAGPDPNPPYGAENEKGPTVMFLVPAYDPEDLEED